MGGIGGRKDVRGHIREYARPEECHEQDDPIGNEDPFQTSKGPGLPGGIDLVQVGKGEAASAQEEEKMDEGSGPFAYEFCRGGKNGRGAVRSRDEFEPVMDDHSHHGYASQRIHPEQSTGGRRRNRGGTKSHFRVTPFLLLALNYCRPI